MSTRPLLFLLALLFCGLMLFPMPAAAGEYGAFASDPTPFWDNNGVALDYESATDSVNVTGYYTSGGDWLTGWLYRKSHVISPSAGAGTGYSVMINVTRASGTSSGGTVFVGTNCQSDFDDVRFTDDDGVTLLSCWREMYTANYAILWVEVQDSLSTSSVMIYLYYGKADATGVSDGPGTFLFFDDFELNSFSRWTAVGSYWSIQTTTVKNGVYAAYGDSGYTIANCGMNKTLASIDYGVMIHSWVRKQSVLSNEIMMGFGNNGAKLAYAGGCDKDDAGTYYYPNWLYYKENCIMIATWYRWEVGWDVSNSSFQFYQDGSLGAERAAKWSDTSSLTSFAQVLSRLSGDIGKDLWLDDVYVRKWLPVEPAHAGWGVEEVPLVPVDFAIPLSPCNYQTFQVGLEVGVLGDTVLTLTPYMNMTSSLWSNQVNGTHIITKAGAVYRHDGFLRLWWSIFEGQRDFRLRVLHWNGSMICDEHFYFGKGRNNFLNFTSTTDFDDSFVIWYVTGDIFYSVWYAGNCITPWAGGVTSGSVPNLYSVGPLGVWSGDNITVDAVFVTQYSMTVEWFGYMRFEQSFRYEINADAVFDDHYSLTVEIDDYVIAWVLQSACASFSTQFVGSLTVTHGGVQEYYVADADTHVGSKPSVIAHLGVWHDLSGCLGVMMSDDSSMYTTRASLDNYTVWVSEAGLDNWTAEITTWANIEHDVEGAGGFIILDYGYPFAEFGTSPSGVAQPHFSTSWWEHPMNQVGPGYLFVSDAEHPVGIVWSQNGTSGGGLGNATVGPYIPNPVLDPFGWLAYQIGTFFTWLATMLISGLAFVFEAALVMQAAAFVFIFNSIAPGLGTAIVSFFSGIISLLVSFVSLLGTMFAVLIAAIGYIQWFVGAIVYWANYGLGLVAELLADDGVKELLVIAPLGIVSFVYLRSGFQGLWDLGIAVVNIALRLCGFVYGLVIGLVDFIMGFVPLMG